MEKLNVILIAVRMDWRFVILYLLLLLLLLLLSND